MLQAGEPFVDHFVERSGPERGVSISSHAGRPARWPTWDRVASSRPARAQRTDVSLVSSGMISAGLGLASHSFFSLAAPSL